MGAPLAIIGGTGIGSRLAAMGGTPVVVMTPHGPLRARLLNRGSQDVYLIQRHASGHKLPPHRINFKAMAAGMSLLGVRACVGTAAVGSLRADWGPETLVLPNDFLDLTYRRLTMHADRVEHVDFSDPFSWKLRTELRRAAERVGAAVHEGGIYVSMDGPRYETPHEIEMVRRLGGELLGMTAASEAIVCREIGLPYACISIVSNLAAGMTSDILDHADVVNVLERAGDRVLSILLDWVDTHA